MFTIYIVFCLIAMAFVSNPSSSEDNQSSLGTDFSIINTEDEKHIDMTNWTPANGKSYNICWNFMRNTSEYLEKELQFILSWKEGFHIWITLCLTLYVRKKCKMLQ